VEVQGRKKQGAAFGYTEVRGYHPQLATCAQTGQVLMSRLRGGSTGAALGAASFLTTERVAADPVGLGAPLTSTGRMGARPGRRSPVPRGPLSAARGAVRHRLVTAAAEGAAEVVGEAQGGLEQRLATLEQAVVEQEERAAARHAELLDELRRWERR